jgi:outer membrane receptor protein involved in Fe transport
VPLGYVKLDIDTHMAGVAVRGNLGVQFVHTNQSSTAAITDPDTGQPNGSVTAGTSYNEVLPSLNLVFDFENRNILRFAAAKTMMRGRIDDEKAASSASVAHGAGDMGAAAAIPAPHIASARTSRSKIFGKASYFSVALFNKNLTRHFTRNDTLTTSPV